MAYADVPDGVRQFLSVAPSLAAILCFVVPGTTAVKIWRAKSTMSYPLMPFLSMAVQSTVWFIYGLLLTNYTVVVPNLVGLVLGSVYTAVYDANHSGDQGGLASQYAGAVGILSFVGGLVVFANEETAAAVIGLVGAAGSILFAFSPLAAVATVIQQGSTESMPLATSVILCLNGLLWTSFGYLVANDANIYAPNFVATVAGLMQLAVHAYYGASPPRGRAAYNPVVKR